MTCELTGYLRETDGTLEPVALLRDGDGDLTDIHGYPLERTDETAELLGWGDTDELTPARVWRNDGGREILVPEPEPEPELGPELGPEPSTTNSTIDLPCQSCGQMLHWSLDDLEYHLRRIVEGEHAACACDDDHAAACEPWDREQLAQHIAHLEAVSSETPYAHTMPREEQPLTGLAYGMYEHHYADRTRSVKLCRSHVEQLSADLDPYEFYGVPVGTPCELCAEEQP